MRLKLLKGIFKFIRDFNDNIYDNLPQWTQIAQLRVFEKIGRKDENERKTEGFYVN